MFYTNQWYKYWFWWQWKRKREIGLGQLGMPLLAVKQARVLATITATTTTTAYSYYWGIAKEMLCMGVSREIHISDKSLVLKLYRNCHFLCQAWIRFHLMAKERWQPHGMFLWAASNSCCCNNQSYSTKKHVSQEYLRMLWCRKKWLSFLIFFSFFFISEFQKWRF